MKEIKAIIQSFQLNKILDTLHETAGLPGCIVSRVETFARATEKEASQLEARERVKLEIVVKDDMVQRVLNLIQKAAHTGRNGDGKIFVIECVDAVRIRTDERGEQAL